LYAPQEFSCSVLPATLSASEGRFETLRGVVAHDYSTQEIEIAPVDANVIELDITLNLLPDERVEVYDQRPYFVSAYGRAVQVDRPCGSLQTPWRARAQTQTNTDTRARTHAHTQVDAPCFPCTFDTTGLQRWHFQTGSPVKIMISSNSSRSPLSHTMRYQKPRLSLLYKGRVSTANDSVSFQDAQRFSPQARTMRKPEPESRMSWIRRDEEGVASNMLRQQNEEEDNFLLTLAFPAEQGLQSHSACGLEDPLLRILAFQKQPFPSASHETNEFPAFAFDEDAEWEGFTLGDTGTPAQFVRQGRCELTWALWNSKCGSTEKCEEYCVALPSCKYFSFSTTALQCYLFQECPSTDYTDYQVVLSYSSYTVARSGRGVGGNVAKCTAKMLVNSKEARVRIDVYGCGGERSRTSRQEGSMEGTIFMINSCPMESSSRSPPCRLDDPNTRHTYYAYWPFQIVFDTSNSNRAVRTRYNAIVTFNTAQVSQLFASAEYDYDMSIYIPSSPHQEAVPESPFYPFISQPGFAQVFNFRKASPPTSIPPRRQAAQQIHVTEQMRAFITCNRSLTLSLNVIRQATRSCETLVELLFSRVESRLPFTPGERSLMCGSTCLAFFHSQIKMAADACSQAWKTCPSHCFSLNTSLVGDVEKSFYAPVPIARALMQQVIAIADVIFAIDTGCPVNELGHKCASLGLSNLLSLSPQHGGHSAMNYFTYANVSNMCDRIDHAISEHGCCLEQQAAGEEAWWARLQHPLANVLLVDLNPGSTYILRMPDLTCNVTAEPILSRCFATNTSFCGNANWPANCCNLTCFAAGLESGQLPYGACSCRCADGWTSQLCDQQGPHVLAEVILSPLVRHEYLGHRQRVFAHIITSSVGIAMESFEAHSIAESRTSRRMSDARALSQAQAEVYAPRQAQAGLTIKFRLRGESARHSFRMLQQLLQGASNGKLQQEMTTAFGKRVDVHVQDARIYDARGTALCADGDGLVACPVASVLLLDPLVTEIDSITCYHCIALYVGVALGVVGLLVFRRSRYFGPFCKHAAYLASSCAGVTQDMVARFVKARQLRQALKASAEFGSAAVKRRLLVELEQEKLRYASVNRTVLLLNMSMYRSVLTLMHSSDLKWRQD